MISFQLKETNQNFKLRKMTATLHSLSQPCLQVNVLYLLQSSNEARPPENPIRLAPPVYVKESTDQYRVVVDNDDDGRRSCSVFDTTTETPHVPYALVMHCNWTTQVGLVMSVLDGSSSVPMSEQTEFKLGRVLIPSFGIPACVLQTT